MLVTCWQGAGHQQHLLTKLWLSRPRSCHHQANIQDLQHLSTGISSTIFKIHAPAAVLFAVFLHPDYRTEFAKLWYFSKVTMDFIIIVLLVKIIIFRVFFSSASVSDSLFSISSSTVIFLTPRVSILHADSSLSQKYPKKI